MAIRLRKVLGGVQPPRARVMARKRKATEAERRARKSPTRLYKPQRDFIGIWLLLLLPYSSCAAGLPGRKSSTQQTTGLHRTMTKVCKSNGEGTFAGTRGNGEVAPKVGIRSGEDNSHEPAPERSFAKTPTGPRMGVVYSSGADCHFTLLMTVLCTLPTTVTVFSAQGSFSILSQARSVLPSLRL
jgi:hypothetical protein